ASLCSLESISGGRASWPAQFWSDLGLFRCRGVALPDRLLGIRQCCSCPARIGPDEISDQHEIGACGGERIGLLARIRKTDARRLEQFGPPLQPLGDRF